MQSFRRLLVLLALSCTGLPAALAQSSPSSVPDQNSTPDLSQSPSQTNPDQSNSGQSSSAQENGGLTPGQLTVQQRIRQRRQQRRTAALHETYDHEWEAYMGGGYLRFTPGANDQRLTWYSWNVGLTQFHSNRLGYTFDARGYFGHAFVGLNESGMTRPEISMYDVLFGPTYRFYLQPKYSISGRVMAGPAYGNFEGDTGSFKNMCNLVPGGTGCLLYPNGITYAASASIVGEYNLGPGLSFRLSPEYLFTGFGSATQASRGFTAGVVYRFGRQ